MENDAKQLEESFKKLGDSFEEVCGIFNKCHKHLSPEQQKEFDKLVKDKNIMKKAKKKAEESFKNMDINFNL